MNFIKLKSINGNEIAVNMNAVSAIIDMPETYDTCRRTRFFYKFGPSGDVTETIDEILDKITSNKL